LDIILKITETIFHIYSINDANIVRSFKKKLNLSKLNSHEVSV